ncbi:hypothetical protein TorRG33x02_220040, partial [Trema orientale]
YSSLSRTLRAEPRSNRNSGDDRPQTFHVKSLIAFIAKEKLVRVLSRAALLAAQFAVIGFLRHRVLSPRHYLRQRLKLLGRRRCRRRRPERCRGPVAVAVEGGEPLSLRRRRRRGGGWSHGARGAPSVYKGKTEGRIGNWDVLLSHGALRNGWEWREAGLCVSRGEWRREEGLVLQCG